MATPGLQILLSLVFFFCLQKIISVSGRSRSVAPMMPSGTSATGGLVGLSVHALLPHNSQAESFLINRSPFGS